MRNFSEAHRFVLALLAAALTCGAARAGESAASFLNISPSAAYSALGARGTAMTGDVNSVFLNPGGLGVLRSHQISAAHTELFADFTYDAVGYGHPLGRRGTLAVGAIYLKKGSIQGRDDSGAPTGSFSAADLAVTLGYGRSINSRLAIGSAVKMIRQKIDRYSASAAALDLGLQYAASSRLRLGGSVNNLGTSVRFISERESLPASANLGAIYRLGALDLMAESSYRINERRTLFGIGAGYNLAGALTLRSGYSFGHALASSDSIEGGETFGRFAGFSAGLGFAFQRFDLDYALVPHQELPATHQFTFKVSY